MPGVLGIYTYDDIADLGLLPCATQVATVAPMIVPPRPALANGKGASSSAIPSPSSSPKPPAPPAMRRSRSSVDYTPLPCVVDAAAALQPDAPSLWDTGNESFRFQRGDQAAVQAAFATAAHVVEIDVVNNRLVIAPMETRARDRTLDRRRVRPVRLRRQRSRHPRPARRQRVPLPPRQHPRLRARRRRRLRHQELPVPRMGHAAVGRAPPRPPGQMGRRPRRGFRFRRPGPRQYLARPPGAGRRTAVSSRWMSARSPVSAPTCPAAAPAVPPTLRPRRWAAATSSRRSSWMCAPPSPTPRRSTPIAAPASPKRTI